MRRGTAIAPLLLAFLTAASAAPQPPTRETPAHVERWRGEVDWTAAADEAVQVLSEYLRVDTTNPPGNEQAGVDYLAAILEREGISWTSLEIEPGRASLVARVEGDGSRGGALCLMHHIDVASYEADKWPADTAPLSGAVSDGHVWGRGALDMKGMGVVQLLSVAWLQRLGVPLGRDVVLLAVADEEIDNRGALQLVEEAWDLADCEYLINEGGLGIRDALFDGQAVHAISVAEKGILWVQMHAEGRAGHGSTPYPGEAPERLLEAMEAIHDGYRPDWRIDPALYQLLSNVGHHKGGLTGAVLRSRFLTRTVAWPRLRGTPATAATLHDTVHLTGMRGAEEPNVVPSRVSAQYDCRLLPGTTPEQHLARLERLVRGIDGISFEVTSAEVSNASPVDDEVFRTLAHYAVEDRPYAVAGPLLSVGFTDSLYLRPRGVKAYGYVPFEVKAEVAETMHGHGERVPVEEVGEGLRRMFSIVVDVTAVP